MERGACLAASLLFSLFLASSALCGIRLIASDGQRRALTLSSQSNDDTPATSLRNRRRQRRDSMLDRERVAQEEKADLARSALLNLPSNEDAECFPVPADCRAEAIEHEHIQFYGFDTLFPRSNLGEIFDSTAEFRDALRKAAREDFFVPDSTLSEEANSLLKDPRSTLMSSWRKPNGYRHITEAFKQYGVSSIDGPEFMQALIALCGTSKHVFGSWIDIVGVRDKKVNHSWHQDSGLEQSTVMVGFPSRNHFVGTGVFSHAIKLSHRLPTPTNTNEPRLWIQMKEAADSKLADGGSASDPATSDANPWPVPVDERYIIRPEYRRGREVMVYDDRDIFHSAPDFAHRESLWRFM